LLRGCEIVVTDAAVVPKGVEQASFPTEQNDHATPCRRDVLYCMLQA